MNLDYAANLSPELVCELERAGRWIGLPLRELELLGQSQEHAQAFVESVDTGRHEDFLDHVDWQVLQAMLHDRPDMVELFGGDPDQGFAVAQ